MTEDRTTVLEVHVMPTYGRVKPDEPIVTLQRQNGQWYHVVGGKTIRLATVVEQLLPMSGIQWFRLAVKEGWVKNSRGR